MQRRSKTVADRIREIFEAEKTIATTTADGSGKTLPIFDSWKPDDTIDDIRMDVLCYLFLDFKEYKPNRTTSLDYSKCYEDSWVSRGFADTALNPEDEALPCQPVPCPDPEDCKCIPAATLGSLTAYKYMIGFLQTDRCKNCQNPFTSNVCQESGIDVDVEGNCVKVPAWMCANCDCKDCNTLQGGGSVPAPYFSSSGSYDLSDIPTDLQGPFGSAAAKYHISPQFLAAVFSGGEHGGNWPTAGPWAVGSSGDSGPFQFLECTWEGWNQPLCKSGYGKADGVFETNQQIIDSIGGYGQDGNSDSLADVNSLYDSSFAAADYLARAGATNNGIPVTDIAKLHDAAAKYNGGSHWKSSMAQNYADRVMKVYNKLNNKLF